MHTISRLPVVFGKDEMYYLLPSVRMQVRNHLTFLTPFASVWTQGDVLEVTRLEHRSVTTPGNIGSGCDWTVNDKLVVIS